MGARRGVSDGAVDVPEPDELGIEPGPDLRELHERILRADPVLTLRRAPTALRRNGLPRDVADFTGRREELDRLTSILTGGAAQRDAGKVLAIVGMAGVGKTTLAIHLAHRLAGRYPDAQLFIDLHAHTAEHELVTPAAALRTLLRTLGVPGERVPDDPDALAACWRAELADRKALLVIDNAASAAQVQPLLFGAAGCLTLVTSRSRLPDLETTHTLPLDVLPPTDAITLIERVFCDDHATAEPEAVRELARLCGYLPLALRIAAARLRSRPTWTVEHLITRLHQGRGRLAELTAGNRSVAAEFSLSYQHLPAEQQRLFRLLGLMSGPDIDPPAAAALIDTQPDIAERLLEDLVDVHLLQPLATNRYRFHDLLRHHARHAVRHTDSEAARQAALTRLADHYLVSTEQRQ